jgi:ParB family chromosome partitioning protein
MPDGNYQIIAERTPFQGGQAGRSNRNTAYIKTAEDDLVMEMGLIENIQREDLNPIEIALAFQKLLEIYHLTQEKLSDRLGKKRATIANYLRLLKLPADIQLGLKNRKIDMGHARALVSLEDPTLQLKIYNQILHYGYSVRKVEELVREALNTSEDQVENRLKASNKTPEEYKALQELLTSQLGLPVKFSISQQGKGSIHIPFRSEAQLEKLLERLDKLMH